MNNSARAGVKKNRSKFACTEICDKHEETLTVLWKFNRYFHTADKLPRYLRVTWLSKQRKGGNELDFYNTWKVWQWNYSQEEKNRTYLRWAPLYTPVSAPCWISIFRGFFRCSSPRGVSSRCRWKDGGRSSSGTWMVSTIVRILHEHFAVYFDISRSQIHRGYGNKVMISQRRKTVNCHSRVQTSASKWSCPWVRLIGLYYSLCVTAMRNTETYEYTAVAYGTTRAILDINLSLRSIFGQH